MDTRSQVKQYVDIAWRRKWWVVVPTVLGLLGGVYRYYTAPKLYSSYTTILVSRQKIPDDIVRSTVTSTIGEMINNLQVQVFSRTYLQRIAEENGLIGPNADEARIERACAQIKRSVTLESDKRNGQWFKLIVQNGDPQRAARIANRLAELFIEQNTDLRVKQASGAANLLDGWVKQTEEQLQKRDAEISRFKQEHMYELPDQQDATLQLLNGSQNQLSALTSEIQFKSERLATLTAESKANRAAAAAAGVNLPQDDPDGRVLAQLERELDDLLISYTDENPLVRKKREQITQFKATHPTLVESKPTTSEEAALPPEAKRLQAELRTLQTDRARVQARVNELTARLANIPMRAQKLAELTRDYDSLKKAYDTKVGQRDEARRSQQVEEAKKGDQFQVQDVAVPGARPISPVFEMLLLMGLAAGAGIGVGIAALLEFLDQSVRSEEQFVELFPDVAILGSIPNLVGNAPAKPRAKGGPTKKAAAS